VTKFQAGLDVIVSEVDEDTLELEVDSHIDMRVFEVEGYTPEFVADRGTSTTEAEYDSVVRGNNLVPVA
jgi:hypothetical protein